MPRPRTRGGGGVRNPHVQPVSQEAPPMSQVGRTGLCERRGKASGPSSASRGGTSHATPRDTAALAGTTDTCPSSRKQFCQIQRLAPAALLCSPGGRCELCEQRTFSSHSRRSLSTALLSLLNDLRALTPLIPRRMKEGGPGVISILHRKIPS